MIHDVEPLRGRHFVSSKGNVLRVEIIGAGAIRLVWSVPNASEEEKREAERWVGSILGPMQATVCDDIEKESTELERWRKEQC